MVQDPVLNNACSPPCSPCSASLAWQRVFFFLCDCWFASVLALVLAWVNMRAAVWLEIDTALCLSPTPVHICAIVAASTSVCVCASVCGSTHACTAGHAFSAGFCCTVSRWRSWKKSLAPNGVRCCCCRCRRTVYLWLPFPSAALFLGSYPAEEREKNISLCASSVLKTGKSL